MKQPLYILSSGKLVRKDYSLMFQSSDNTVGTFYIPVHQISDIYVFGVLTTNTIVFSLLSQNKIPLHTFNYYGYYAGTYYPREYLISGDLLLKQAEYVSNETKTMEIAREIVRSSSLNMRRNLKYYMTRSRPNLEENVKRIDELIKLIDEQKTRNQLMAIEGNIREIYYSSFTEIIKDIDVFQRNKRPPKDMVNALISFGNGVCYTTVLSEIYHTYLNPSLSFLHAPFERRFSLALDIADIFKPILVDRVVFKLMNNRMINESHFLKNVGFYHLNKWGKEIFLNEFREKLNTTIKIRELNRHVSYRRLIRLELYKIIKHILGDKKYKGFEMLW